MELELLMREHHLRTPYVHHVILSFLIPYLVDDVAKITTEYVSPAVLPKEAIKCSLETYEDLNDDKDVCLGKIKVVFSYLLGVACTNPVKLANLGMDVFENVSHTKRNIYKWMNKQTKSWSLSKFDVVREFVFKVGEPLLMEDFPSDDNSINRQKPQYLIFLPNNFVSGRIRFFANYDFDESLHNLNKRDLEFDGFSRCFTSALANANNLIGEITEKELCETTGVKQFRKITVKYIYKWQDDNSPVVCINFGLSNSSYKKNSILQLVAHGAQDVYLMSPGNL